jgi:YebC/PmpR family DNA-binding regulatory protein
MSGHSKWATIKRKKGALDAKRGKIFTKVNREITVAARQGGGNPNDNPRLRLAIEKAKAVNMPNDNIARAIKKGSGEQGEGSAYEEYLLEGYGPAGVAVMLEVMTDNRNRTTPELRKIFQKSGGALGESGCVAWQFQKKGYFMIERRTIEEDRLMEVALDAGADDVITGEQEFEVLAPPDLFHKVKQRLESQKIAFSTAELSMIPQNHLKIAGDDAKNMVKLMEDLEDHDDVQNVYANCDIDEAAIAST